MEAAKMLREVELSPMVSEWLKSQGYSVYAEVGVWSPCDHVGVRWSDESIIFVEMKLNCTWQLIRQASCHQNITPLVYVATRSKPRAASMDKIRSRGLGLLVDGEVIIEPSASREIVERHRARILDKCRRAIEGEVGGKPTTKGDGPRIRCEKRLREYLALHPQADWKELFANVPNHYATARSMAGVFCGLVK